MQRRRSLSPPAAGAWSCILIGSILNRVCFSDSEEDEDITAHRKPRRNAIRDSDSEEEAVEKGVAEAPGSPASSGEEEEEGRRDGAQRSRRITCSPEEEEEAVTARRREKSQRNREKRRKRSKAVEELKKKRRKGAERSSEEEEVSPSS